VSTTAAAFLKTVLVIEEEAIPSKAAAFTAILFGHGVSQLLGHKNTLLPGYSSRKNIVPTALQPIHFAPTSAVVPTAPK
jgi:hypothetical protein